MRSQPLHRNEWLLVNPVLVSSQPQPHSGSIPVCKARGKLLHATNLLSTIPCQSALGATPDLPWLHKGSRHGDNDRYFNQSLAPPKIDKTTLTFSEEGFC